MTQVLRIVLQILLLTGFGWLLVEFATAPTHEFMKSDSAQIKMAFIHKGPTITECRRLTPQEIAALPPHMRKPSDCPRERLPIRLEVELDSKTLFAKDLPPTGLFGDGPASIFAIFNVTPGQHLLKVRLRDSRRETGFDHELTSQITVVPRQNMVIDFAASEGGLVLRPGGPLSGDRQ